MDDPLVSMSHVRAAGYCATGLREFCRHYDLDLTTFCRDGLPCSTIEATGDALALKVVAIARQEEPDGR